jgi:hypothetical protein
MVDLAGLPAAERIERGLSELAAGVESVDSLLVAIAAPRLARAGVQVPARAEDFPEAELRLYALLGQQQSRDAYSEYNALLRELVSFERALEHRTRAAKR